MIFEKKICFILNWAREINMFETLIKRIPKKNSIFVINDLNKSVKKHVIERKRLVNILKKKKLKFYFLSKILYKKKFRIVISTGDIGISKISVKSISKFIYAHTAGILLSILRIDMILKKLFNRDFTVRNINTSFYYDTFIEKSLGEKTIKYPNGLDRNIKYFPNNDWSKVFDIYFTSSKIEKN